MKLYELTELTFKLSERFTLEIDNLALECNEKLALLGANGAGKTTLLRILAFLERPTRCRRCFFRGKDALVGSIDRTGMGFLKQRPYLFNGTVAANLAYPLKVRGLPRSEIRARVDAMLTRIDLRAHAESRAQKLSGGEQKRLALGRILIAEPEILLLDEPTAHLDRHSCNIMERVLEEMTATLVMTTHDSHFAHRIADRVMILRAGRISPSLPENILPGSLENGALRTLGGLRIELPPEAPPPTRKDMPAVMIDPRDLVISHAPLPSSMRNYFSGRVSSVRQTGGNVWLEIDCGDRLIAIISYASYRELEINVGREVVVSFKANAVEVL